MNQSLAHPLGANFKEIINIFSYKRGNYKFILKNMFVNIGMDSLAPIMDRIYLSLTIIQVQVVRHHMAM